MVEGRRNTIHAVVGIGGVGGGGSGASAPTDGTTNRGGGGGGKCNLGQEDWWFRNAVIRYAKNKRYLQMLLATVLLVVIQSHMLVIMQFIHF